MFSYELLHMDTLVLTNQQELTFISSVRTLDAIKMTYLERSLMGTNGEIKEFVLSVRFGDIYIYIYISFYMYSIP